MLSLLFVELTLAEEVKIKIGYVTDLTGKGATIGTQSIYGAKIAVKELSKEGYSIELFVEDSRMDTNQGISATNFLINNKNVDVIFSDFTPISAAIASAVKTGNKLFVFQSPAKSILNTWQYGFRTFLDYTDGCRQLARYFKKKGYNNIGMLKINMEFGERCLMGAKEIYPKLKEFEHSSGEDLRTAILTFKNAKLPAYIQMGFEPDALNRISAARQYAYNVPVGTVEAIITDQVREKGGDYVNGNIVFSFSHVSENFINKFLEENPKRTRSNIESAALAYMHIRQVVKAWTGCPDHNLPCLSENLSKSPPDDIIGFRGWKDREAIFNMGLKQIMSSGLNLID